MTTSSTITTNSNNGACPHLRVPPSSTPTRTPATNRAARLNHLTGPVKQSDTLPCRHLFSICRHRHKRKRPPISTFFSSSESQGTASEQGTRGTRSHPEIRHSRVEQRLADRNFILESHARHIQLLYTTAADSFCCSPPSRPSPSNNDTHIARPRTPPMVPPFAPAPPSNAARYALIESPSPSSVVLFSQHISASPISVSSS